MNVRKCYFFAEASHLPIEYRHIFHASFYNSCQKSTELPESENMAQWIMDEICDQFGLCTWRWFSIKKVRMEVMRKLQQALSDWVQVLMIYYVVSESSGD